MTRDLTEKQYQAALLRHGFTPSLCGYVRLPHPYESIEVYARNGGDRRRDRLAYLMRKFTAEVRS